MSCLDAPRLHFKGHFHANPSTINNTLSNYAFRQDTNPNPLVMSWDGYGDATFSIDAEITALIGEDGKPYEDPDLMCTAIKSCPGLFGYTGAPAKLVDVDVDQQTRTRFYGLNIEIGEALLQGHFVDTAFILNLWFGKAPSAGGDSGAGGLFQTVFDPVQWGDVSCSPFLTLLYDTSKQSGSKISMRFAVFGYDSSPGTSGFTSGTIIGTVGLAGRKEPVNRIVNRFLSPSPNSPLYYSSAAVHTGNGTAGSLTIDLSNSIPDQTPGGLPLADLGTVQMAILGPGEPTIVGEVPYQNNAYQQTGGIVQFDLDADQLTLARNHPLAVLIEDGTIALRENDDGLYAAVDAGYLFMNPGERATVNLYATKFGEHYDGEFPIDLLPSPNGTGANNNPQSGLGFSNTVTTKEGKGEIQLTAGQILENPPRRQNIDGQVYFVGGPWASGADTGYIGGPLTVKVFNAFTAPAKATWKDVASIFYQYYILYGTMAGRVDLSNYESVKQASAQIKIYMNYSTADPSHMPVTRDLSAAKRKMILDWIDSGCRSE